MKYLTPEEREQTPAYLITCPKCNGMIGAHVDDGEHQNAALKAELADSQSDVATLLTAVEEQRQYIERLKARVEELQAWRAAVPLTPIECYICDKYGDDDATSDGDWKTILAWLDGMAAGVEVGG